MTNLSISISSEIQAWINTQIDSGVYTNASDYLQDLILQDKQYRENISLALIESEQSGTSSAKVKDIINSVKKSLKNA